MEADNSSVQKNTCPAVRILKIEATGDFWKGGTKPKIRLTGRWLERAGFRPGDHVQVMCVRPGLLELRFCKRIAAEPKQAREEPEYPF